MPEIKYAENPNEETAFVTQDDGTRSRAVLTAAVEGDIEFPNNPNSTKVMVTVGGVKRRAVAVANVAGGGGGGGDSHNKGWFATQAALEAAYATAEAGDWAIVGATDTVWIWDTDNSEWKDSDQKGQVTSVNGQTGDVVLDLLPTQTGNAGKFLSTDGTDASWSDKPLVNKTTASESLGLLSQNITTRAATAVGMYSGSLGNSSSSFGRGAIASSNAVAIGSGTNAAQKGVVVGMSTVVGPNGIGIGYGASTSENTSGAIQLNTSGSRVANADSNTFKVANANGNFEIMSADGTIPEARLADMTNAAQGQVLALDSNLNAVWQAGGAGGNSVPQYDIMPTAGADNVGNIVQYAGTTDYDFTNGYFYKCVGSSEITDITISPATQSGTVLEWDVSDFNRFLDYFCENAHIDDKTEIAKITIAYEDEFAFKVTAYNSSDVEIGSSSEDSYYLQDTFIIGNLLNLVEGDQVTVIPTTGMIYNWEQANTQDKELPDLTSAYGYLFTNGDSVSWSNKPLVNWASGSGSLAVGDGAAASGSNSLAVGVSAQTSGTNSPQSIVIGYNAYSYNAPLGIAIGSYAHSRATGAIQIGGANTYRERYINSDANTLKIGNANGNFELMSADGTIPAARHAALPTTDGTYVLKLVIANGVPTLSWVAE